MNKKMWGSHLGFWFRIFKGDKKMKIEKNNKRDFGGENQTGHLPLQRVRQDHCARVSFVSNASRWKIIISYSFIFFKQIFKENFRKMVVHGPP